MSLLNLQRSTAEAVKRLDYLWGWNFVEISELLWALNSMTKHGKVAAATTINTYKARIFALQRLGARELGEVGSIVLGTIRPSSLTTDDLI